MAKLTIDRGTTYTINYEYLKDGVPATLVGATVRFTMKAEEYDTSTDDTTAAVKKDVTVHTDGANGLTQIVIDPTDTATLTPAKYFYDIKVEEDGGAIYKTDEGTITLDGSPTNRMA